ncbi:MAG TPA: Mur ligase domain-containing protein [Candidatus Binatia bacterium]|nr:Mur ligase domain-containing protein [Candidatus Binatia bacterium]
MHIYFSGIGGTAIGPLALIAKQAGYQVSGSDARDSQYIEYLRSKGITDIHIGQTKQQITNAHDKNPIDWFVYSSALKAEARHPELEFCESHNIRATTRDELLNEILSQKKLKLIAIAGTHGKTTTTAMVIWLFKQLGIPVSYSVGAKISFGDMGSYQPDSQYFVYEADEFDRNFLAFHPFYSLVVGVAYDHHEIFPTEANYRQAFADFLAQSQRALLWQEDAVKLGLDEQAEKYRVESYDNPQIEKLGLGGLYNRRDAWLALSAVSQILGPRPDELYDKINQFPGVSRRFELIAENLYSDYAHTPEKIQGVMSVALEQAAKSGQKVVVVYEPLTNRRMHYTRDAHHSVFEGASAIYWVPSYLAREDPAQKILNPEELIKSLSPALQSVARPMELNDELKQAIQSHLDTGDLVVALSGGGGSSLDEWLRRQFSSKA